MKTRKQLKIYCCTWNHSAAATWDITLYHTRPFASQPQSCVLQDMEWCGNVFIRNLWGIRRAEASNDWNMVRNPTARHWSSNWSVQVYLVMPVSKPRQTLWAFATSKGHKSTLLHTVLCITLFKKLSKYSMVWQSYCKNNNSTHCTWRLKIQRRSEDRYLNRTRSKLDPVDWPVRTARTIVHHNNCTQYYSTVNFYLSSSIAVSHLRFGKLGIRRR